MKKVFSLYFLIVTTLFSKAQLLEEKDRSLAHLYSHMFDYDEMVRYDSIAPAFKKEMMKVLSESSSFDFPFDSLSKNISITISPDKKIRFFSWDELTGGTWHNIAVLAQYKVGNGKIKAQQIHSGASAEKGDFTDSNIYQVYEIMLNQQKHYLTFAWGTHGGGNHHWIAQVFNIENDSLVKKNSCFENQEDLVIEIPRVLKAGLKYDAEKKEISFTSYEEYMKFEDHPKGQFTRLRLMNQIFRKI